MATTNFPITSSIPASTADLSGPRHAPTPTLLSSSSTSVSVKLDLQAPFQAIRTLFDH